MRSNRYSFVWLLAFALLCAILCGACSKKEEMSLNIPEGSATLTLKEFARQTDVEILFDLKIVYGVETNAVKGNYEPGSALRMMLAGTPLGVDFEKDSGAYAVFRKQF
jgi:iron complex outermembrane recepter protein